VIIIKRTVTAIAARCNELNDIFVFTDISHKLNLLQHQLAIFVAKSTLEQNSSRAISLKRRL